MNSPISPIRVNIYGRLEKNQESLPFFFFFFLFTDSDSRRLGENESIFAEN